MKDQLGDRMKERYEDRTRMFLPRRTYTLIRVDGKAFHTLTRGFDKPFDLDLLSIMDWTSLRLCEEIQGAKIAYVQSDEISVLLTDFEKDDTNAWFDGNIQKMASISAAIATAEFNKAVLQTSLGFGAKNGKNNPKFFKKEGGLKTAYFDSRVFTIADPIEVENYFIWRQNDATRNSIQMVARSLYSHKECENKNTSQLNEMIFQKGQNWNDYPVGQKRGRVIAKTLEPGDLRAKWRVLDPPIFTQDRNFLKSYIPKVRINEENS